MEVLHLTSSPSRSVVAYLLDEEISVANIGDIPDTEVLQKVQQVSLLYVGTHSRYSFDLSCRLSAWGALSNYEKF